MFSHRVHDLEVSCPPLQLNCHGTSAVTLTAMQLLGWQRARVGGPRRISRLGMGCISQLSTACMIQPVSLSLPTANADMPCTIKCHQGGWQHSGSHSRPGPPTHLNETPQKYFTCEALLSQLPEAVQHVEKAQAPGILASLSLQLNSLQQGLQSAHKRS